MESIDNEIIPSLKESIFNDSILSLGEEIGEMSIDALCDNEILSEVPFVKTLLAIGKTGLAIRERNLMKQTIAFVKGVNDGNISDESKVRYMEKYDNNSSFAQNELERILILLDANIDTEKSKVLGRLYCSYIIGAISWDYFCECSEVNRRMFLEDYNLLMKMGKRGLSLSNQDRYRMGRLIGLGLVVEKDSPAAYKSPIEQFQGSMTMNEKFRMSRDNMFGVDKYELTTLGKGFVSLIHDKDNEDKLY